MKYYENKRRAQLPTINVEVRVSLMIRSFYYFKPNRLSNRILLMTNK